MRFRKKPVEIEAHLWDGDFEALEGWLDETGALPRDEPSPHESLVSVFEERYAAREKAPNVLVIHTLEGDMRAYPGEHWIICGVNKELYPCEVSIFEATYEAVE